MKKNEEKSVFLANPKIIENYPLLQEIGFFDYIDNLHHEAQNYRSLLTRGLDIFNRTTLDEILNATVWQISDHFIPSFISFLWKPIQNKDAVTIRSYRNYKPVDMLLKVGNITAFEDFFRQFPKPISFDLLAYELKNDKAIEPFKALQPELFIPILGPMGLYGIIVIGRKILDEGYSQEELQFLQHLMSFVSQAIKNLLHYEHSLRDVKTGLYNYGFFITRLNEEVARSMRGDYCSSLLVIDVDNFKDFNDIYGHLAGDRVLEHLALALKKGVRNDDIPSRFGGEEFTLLLPNTDRSAAWMIAERLRNNVAAMTVPWKTPLPQVTISLGVFTFNSKSGMDATEIIRCADNALYLSKERGRNRSTVWGAGLFRKIANAQARAEVQTTNKK